MKLVVLIPTYNRNKCLFRLTQRLKTLDPTVHIIVVDDASPLEVETDYIDTYFKFAKNNGKKGFWRVLNKLHELACETQGDLFMVVVDDALPKNEFFTDAIRLWREIKDDKKIAMHLSNNDRKQNWTNFIRRSYNKEIYWTQTTELSCLCRREFVEYRYPEVPLSRWANNPALGSGVGPLINHHFIGIGKTIYGVKSSLITQNTMCTGSQMNKEERIKHPWKLK